MNTNNRLAHLVAVVLTAVFVSAVPAPAQECPEFVGFLDLGCSARDVALSAGYAYVVCGEELIVVDVSDPHMPVEVGDLSWDDDWAAHVSVFGDYAFVSVQGYGFLSWLKVVDISQPSIPVELGSIVLSALSPPVVGINAATEGYVYIVRGDEVLVIDVSNPSSPTQAGVLTVASIGDAQDVSVAGDFAYVVFDYGMYVFDISDPLQPEVMDGYPADDHCYLSRVALDFTGYAYVTRQYFFFDGGLTLGILDVVDVRNPEQPFLVGSDWSEDLEFLDIAVSGGYAYMTERWFDELHVINISNPTEPVWAGIANYLGSGAGVTAGGGYLYIADGDAGLTVFRECGPFYDGFESGDTVPWSLTVPKRID